MITQTRRVLLAGAVILALSAVAQAQDGRPGDPERDRRPFVGSWTGTLDNGEHLLASFTGDGVALTSIQGEVNTMGPVLSPAHGAWAHAGGRRLLVTLRAVLYGIQSGDYQGSGKLRALLTLDASGNTLSGPATVEIFGPDGALLVTFPHTIELTRVRVERLE